MKREHPNDMAKLKSNVTRFFVYLFLIVIGVTVVYPLVWTFFGSVRDETQFSLNPWGFPEQLDLSVYVEVLTEYGLARNILNSLIMSIVGVLAIIWLSLTASYALARLRWRGAKFMMAFFLSGIMIPVHSTLIPLYVTLRPLAKVDERLALMIPYVVFGLPVAIFIISNYMKSIPLSLEEAAVIEGCSLIKSFFNIILPMTKPAIATVSIFSFMGIWNELMFALVFLQRSTVQTLPLGILRFTGLYTTQWQPTMAAIVIAMIPSLIIYSILQEKIIGGMTAGSLKG
ncbi:carbohydrate ABC transporter permease [Sphaerochaeta halotolerans]|uniref:carbohydrate ABC transporter permease n=1 Tax=Sphaerochaeta halotolerans TaxID=2293840 RepID=UPI001367C781|nr:carbohydrate ABC transporter permease [Sphaerochaeta halotolerans]MXI85235.1 ABC transporter permease subunit [Sphaerochaeta halotolerans]